MQPTRHLVVHPCKSKLILSGSTARRGSELWDAAHPEPERDAKGGRDGGRATGMVQGGRRGRIQQEDEFAKADLQFY